MSRPTCSTLTLTIRKAQNLREIDEAAELYVRSGTRAFTWRRPGHFRAEDFKRFAEDEEVWLALMGEAIVGILSIFRPENFIHCLYVDPDAQRLGVGRALIGHLRKVAGGALTLKLDVPNTQAIAFYRATGWKPLTGPGDEGFDRDGVRWARYRLE